jgi:hypothetical protein
MESKEVILAQQHDKKMKTNTKNCRKKELNLGVTGLYGEVKLAQVLTKTANKSVFLAN